MKMSDVQQIARSRGVNPGRTTKVDLVRALQQTEGNAPCFQTGRVACCGQVSCLWREACA